MTEQEAEDLVPGDVVVYIGEDKPHYSFTHGKSYVVGGDFYLERKIGDIRNLVCVVKDDTGKSNGWRHGLFAKTNSKLGKVLFKP